MNGVSQPWAAHAYQRRAVEFALRQTAAGLFMCPGLGKTSVILKVLKTLKEARQMRSALIIAPLRVCQLVWPDEIQKWADFEGLTWTVLHGEPRKREALLSQKSDLYIINPDGLPWLFDKQARRFEKLNPDVLVVDESTQFKHTNTKRFKLLKPYLPKFKRRYILTGTPTPRSYLDLFGQIYCLDLGAALSPYITHYRATYFYCRDKMGWNWELNAGAEKQIQERIKPLVLRLDAADYLELPELVTNVIRVDLPAKARKVYDDLETQMLAVITRDTTVTAVNVGVATGKCAQVANGGLYYDTVEELRTNREGVDSGNGAGVLDLVQRRTLQLHDAKTEALKELVEELQGEPLLVAYEFQHDLARLRAAFGDDLPYIGGGVTERRARELVAAWNAGQLPLLAGHPAAMGHGLNLQGAGSAVCFYGINWDHELMDQFLRRVRRQGQKSKIVVAHYIVARGTVDEAKMTALRKKARTQQGLLDALRAYAMERAGRTKS